MATKYAELFTDLARPFEGWEVRERAGGKGRTLHYVDAATVMNRLDEVLGPENWSDEYTYFGNACLCTLTVTLPGGETIRRTAMGAYMHRGDEAILQDAANLEGYRAKAAQSDAIKRAATHLGVGRYLGKSGVPAFARHAFEEPPAEPRPAGRQEATTAARQAARRQEAAPLAPGHDPTLPPPASQRAPSATGDADSPIHRRPAAGPPRDPEAEPAPRRPLRELDPPEAPEPAANGRGEPADDRPLTGRAFFAWIRQRVEDGTDAGLLKYINDWAKQTGIRGRIVDWDRQAVEEGLAEAQRRLAQGRPGAYSGQARPRNGTRGY
jgi:hypothetical protein